jgi:hypothetical protein
LLLVISQKRNPFLSIVMYLPLFAFSFSQVNLEAKPFNSWKGIATSRKPKSKSGREHEKRRGRIDTPLGQK